MVSHHTEPEVKILTGPLRPSLPPLGSLPWPSLLLMVLQPWPPCSSLGMPTTVLLQGLCSFCSLPGMPLYPTILPFMKTLNEPHSLLTLMATFAM